MANCNYKVNIKDIQSKYSFKIFCSSDNAEIQAEIGNLEDLTTTAKNNLVSAINEVDGNTTTNANAISGLQSSKEDKSNKVISISSASTDTQYPSAKAVYDSQVTQDETISTLETNLEETQNELDYYKTIYNVLPKVSGNGESITLDNTGESILKLDPRGQCKQDSTNGINLYKTIPEGTNGSFKITPNEDGSYTLNGTATNSVNFESSGNTLEAGTYTLQCKVIGTLPSNTNNRAQVYSAGQNFNVAIVNNDVNDRVAGATLSATATDVRFRIRVEGGFNYQNVKVYPMFVIGTYSSETMPEIEPYTGGIPAPNPSYPYPIHEGSGDNTIKVEGKNLLNIDNIEATAASTIVKTKTGFTFTKVSVGTTDTFVGTSTQKLEPNTTYSLYASHSAFSGYFYFYTDAIFGNALPRTAINNTQEHTSYKFTTDDTGNVIIGFYATSQAQGDVNTFDNIVLYKGEKTLTELQEYSQYTGTNYELDLGVENLFSPSKVITDSDSSNVYITDDGKWIRFITGSNGRIKLYPNVKTNTQYTFKATYKSDTSSSNQFIFYAMYTDGTNSELIKETTTDTNEHTLVGTTQSGKTLDYIMTGNTNALVGYVKIEGTQLEIGTKANSYSEYGKTPIKMRGIGTDEDYFVRNSGKNLIGLGTQLNGYRDGGTGNFQIHDTSIGYYFSTSDLPDTITISCINGNRANISYYNVLPQNGANSLDYSNSNTLPRTINVNKTYTYIHIQFSYNQAVNNIMINEGSSALPYEPYGTGLWCKYNAIGKKVFVGTEIWDYSSTTSSFATYNPFEIVNKTDYSTQTKLPDILSNYYTPITWQSLTGGGIGVAMLYASSTLQLRLSSSETTSESFKTWLSTHNVEVLYPLATPYLSLIEDTTLISQLDKVEKALAKQGKTNISQVNNDAPFKIYASALKEIE